MDTHEPVSRGTESSPGVRRPVEWIAKTAERQAPGGLLMDNHPAAELFPLMTEHEFGPFKADIATSGLLEPIWLCEGKILDGRNRYRACCELGLQPLFRTYSGVSPVAFAWSLNGERRHLTHGQRSAIAVEMLPALQEESRKRQLAGLKRGATLPVPPDVVERDSKKGETVDAAARIVGISGTSVQRAKAIKASNPEAFEQIKRGVLNIAPVYEEMRKHVAPRAQPRDVRQEEILRLAKEGCRSSQIAEELNISAHRVRLIARRAGIVLPDATIGHVQKISVRRVIEESVSTLEGLALGLQTVNGGRIESTPEEALEWVKSIDASLRIISKLKKTLRGFYE